jgi:hypothetical protein
MAWLTDRAMAIYGTVKYYPQGGQEPVVLAQDEGAAHVRQLLDLTRSGVHVERPDWWDVFIAYGEAMVRNATHLRSLEREKELIRTSLRDALVEAWEGHQDHITRDSLNEFLENNGMEPTVRLLSGEVTVYFEPTTIHVEDVEVPWGDDPDEAMAEAAAERIDKYNLRVDTDASEVEYD